MKKRNKKVLVCLSGGVDSSVAAALLVKQGYDVTAAFMVNFDDPQKAQSCWRGDYQDALRVCAKLGIKLLRLDFQKEYKRDVLNYMYKEYTAGRTPNPDVLCNKFIKFGAWLDKAIDLGFDYIATGHYARVSHSVILRSPPVGGQRRISSVKLLQSKDKDKDQTYFLHQLNQKQLKRVSFPVGNYTKSQVRDLAKKFGLPTAEKEESMGICFVGEVPMKEFLKDKIKAKRGNIVMTDGKIIGEHEGLGFYTIGQRHSVIPAARGGCHSRESGNPVAVCLDPHFHGDNILKDNTKPLFVVDKNIPKNELVVGFGDDKKMFKDEIFVTDVNWVSGQLPKFPLKCKVRLRHRQELQNCVVLAFCHSEGAQRPKNLSSIVIKFTTPQRAVTPGQFAVIYSGDKCLGGGVIT